MPDRAVTGRDVPTSPVLTVTDAALTAASKALGLAAGHTFADVRTMTPGSGTMAQTRAMLAYLAAEGWFLIRLYQVEVGDADPPRSDGVQAGPSIPPTKAEP